MVSDPIFSMKIRIDFSIFESPIRAFGNATGELQVGSPPKVGGSIKLLESVDTQGLHGFDGSLRVTDINPVPGQEDVLFLEDVVMTSHEAAKALASRLEAKLNLFCVEYER